MKRIIGILVLILVIYYIGTNPGPAADITRNIGDAIGNAFDGIGTFLRNLST